MTSAISASGARSNVLVIGGCHVTGWQIGESPRFWSEAADDWNGGSGADCHGPSSLKKSIEFLQEDDTKLSDTLLIIQLGNFEASSISTINPAVKSIVGKLKKSSVASKVTLPTRACAAPPALAWKLSMKIAAKGALLLALEWLFSSDGRNSALAALQDNFVRLFDIVKNREPKVVIVLSTFPTASPVINFYRQQLNHVVENIAISRSFIYIDVFHVLRMAAENKAHHYRSLFADGFHLSAAGHALISEEIRRQLGSNRTAC